MNVAHVALISFHTCPLASPGEGKAGGMNVYVRELSRCFSSVGVKVDLYTRCHADHKAAVAQVDENIRVIHLDGGPIDAPLSSYARYLGEFLDNMVGFIDSNSLRYDVVHSHYWLSAWIGQRVSKARNVAHCVTFHTLAQLKVQAKAGESESSMRFEVERESMASADLVVASSPHEREAMVRFYDAPRDRIQVVPCGVDLSLFRPLDIGESRKKLGLNGEKVIIYVGRVEPIKGLDLLLRSTAIMEGREALKVLIVGGNLSQEEEVQKLKDLADELGIASITEFIGIVDQKHLPMYYSAADVCVVPSHYESFGLAALESLACGTPVVATRVGGLPAVVQHGRNGYLMPWRCPEPFANSMEVILYSEGLQRSMSVEARKRAEGMGWENVAQETLQLYDLVCQGVPVPKE
ncbi:MAG: glycosyltransferase [Dehalococcoidia bacterium]|nr:glycosyltransferase [Dehalococcoidia bacterium]